MSAEVPPLPAELPSEFIAVSFSASAALPPTPQNQDLVDSALAGLTRECDVIWIGNRDDTPFARNGARAHTIDHLTTPRTELGLQTAVLSREGWQGETPAVPTMSR